MNVQRALQTCVSIINSNSSSSSSSSSFLARLFIATTDGAQRQPYFFALRSRLEASHHSVGCFVHRHHHHQHWRAWCWSIAASMSAHQGNGLELDVMRCTLDIDDNDWERRSDSTVPVHASVGRPLGLFFCGARGTYIAVCRAWWWSISISDLVVWSNKRRRLCLTISACLSTAAWSETWIAKGDVFHWRNNQIVVVQSNRYASSMHSSCYREKPRSGIWHIFNVLLDKFSGVYCFTEEFIVTVAYAYSQNKLGLLLCWLHRFLLWGLTASWLAVRPIASRPPSHSAHLALSARAER